MAQRQYIVVNELLLGDETNGVLQQLAAQKGRREHDPNLRVWSVEAPDPTQVKVEAPTEAPAAESETPVAPAADGENPSF